MKNTFDFVTKTSLKGKKFLCEIHHQDRMRYTVKDTQQDRDIQVVSYSTVPLGSNHVFPVSANKHTSVILYIFFLSNHRFICSNFPL
jgi:hypothetical protein